MAGQGAWTQQARAVARLCASGGLDMAGVYVHGSAALGGFMPTSDLDILVVANGEADWVGLGRGLLDLSTPFPLELSVVSAGAARRARPPWGFRLHVAAPDVLSFDEGEGDPDLIAHYAVTRQSGIAIVGPSPDDVFGPVDRRDLLAYLAGELRWGLAHADQRYAVLNACRAVAYAVDGVLVSKVAGARWWRDHKGGDPVVDAALDAQRNGVDLGPSSPEATAFVRASIEVLVAAT